MYSVNVMYPRSDNTTFDLQWYLDVHVPMGLGLLWKNCGVKPAQFILSHDTFGLDRTESSSDYFLIATMLFNRRDEAEAFIDLFEMPGPAALLSADWPKFTVADPIAVLAEVTQLDADVFIARADEVIEQAANAQE